MSHRHTHEDIQWTWFDGNQWELYDPDTTYQIESGHICGADFVSLNKGPFFGKYQNVHRVYFKYNTHPPTFLMINIITKEITKIKRVITLKPIHDQNRVHSHSNYYRHDHDHSHSPHPHPPPPKITTSSLFHHDNIPMATRRSSSCSSLLTTTTTMRSSAPRTSALSNILIIKIYKNLYTAGYNKMEIDRAIKQFNNKYSSSSSILHKFNKIIRELIRFINDMAVAVHVPSPLQTTEEDEEDVIYAPNDEERGYVDPDYDTDDKKERDSCSTIEEDANNHVNAVSSHRITEATNADEKEETSPTSPPPSRINGVEWKIGAWIEIMINNKWIIGKIIKIDLNLKHFFVEYKDKNTKQSITIKLHQIVHKNKYRALQPFEPQQQPQKSEKTEIDGNNGHKKSVWVPRSRSLSSSPSKIKGGGGLSAAAGPGRFNFEYHKDNKKNDAKNAKHPSEYINRKCYKCRSMMKNCRIPPRNKHKNKNRNKLYRCSRCKDSGYFNLSCSKCPNSSGIYSTALSLVHNGCKGNGCNRCNNTGRYPLYDKMCNHCRGTGIFKVKCGSCAGHSHGHGHVSNSKFSLFDDGGGGGNNGSNNGVDEINLNNRCISGYRLPKIVPFFPKRDNDDFNFGVHGVDGEEMEGMYNMKRLYHATDENGANDIKETGLIFRGDTNKCHTNGIYFTDHAKEAQIAASHHSKGYLVIADVFTGKTKEEYNKNNKFNFNSLHSAGYDSICGYWQNNGIQFVVYHWDQVWVHIVLPYEQINFDTL